MFRCEEIIQINTKQETLLHACEKCLFCGFRIKCYIVCGTTMYSSRNKTATVAFVYLHVQSSEHKYHTGVYLLGQSARHNCHTSVCPEVQCTKYYCHRINPSNT
jgi:hypothetical protein